MAFVYIPEIKKVPEGATKEERIKMFNEYKEDLIRCNPNFFNEDGTVRTFWKVLKYTFIKPSQKQL